VLALLTTGCRVEKHESAAAASNAATPPLEGQLSVPPVVLPDLAKISLSAQNQLRNAYASLLTKKEGTATTDGDLARAYGDLGQLLMATGYRDTAEACFLNAQALDRDDIRWPYYLAHVYNASGDSAKAAASFERALRVQPDDVPALVWLGRAELDRGRLDQAERCFEKVLARQSRSPSALSGLGQVALAKRDYPRAVKYLEEALAVDSKAVAIHYSLAMAYRGTGDVAKAEAQLRQRSTRKIDLPDPLMAQVDALLTTAVAYEVRGREALENGDWPAAAENFRKGIELAPDAPSLRHKLGTVLAMSGDTPGAMRQFELVAKRWPGFAKGQYSLGVILASKGRYPEAVDRFTIALRSDPTDVPSQLQLAAALRASGRFEAALDHYKQAAALDPRLAEARFGYAIALVCLKRYQEARDRFIEAMTVFPDQPGFAHATARLLAAAPDERARDGRRAVEILQALLGGRQPSIALAETMAMALAEAGRYGDAATWQREAMAAAKSAGSLDLLPRIAENLTLYEHGKPCRTPWGDEMAFVTL
jgi:tetratricopeptide (TPR) repeat protein